jgi:molybdopterin converting factor small subunit
MATISIHYWAGAKAAAGVGGEEIEAQSVNEALAVARANRADPKFDRVLSISSVLIDGVAVHQAQLDRVVQGAVKVEILPPFAGGS